MSATVQTQPALSKPTGFGTLALASSYITALYRDLFRELVEIRVTLNNKQSVSDPVAQPSFAVADLPDATLYEGATIYVSNETGGATLAFSDGTNWRRAQDRNVVS